MPDGTYRTVQYGDIRFAYVVLPGDYPTNFTKSPVFFNYFRVTVLSSSESSEIIRYFVFAIALVQPMYANWIASLLF